MGGCDPGRQITCPIKLSEDSLVRCESDCGFYVSEKIPDFVAVHEALLRVDDALLIVLGGNAS